MNEMSEAISTMPFVGVLLKWSGYFCLTLIFLMALSEALLSGGTLG
jgi:hypothetical protein